MTAPAQVPAEVTHDAVTAAMLRHRRLLATLVLLALAAVSFWVVVALVRARTQADARRADQSRRHHAPPARARRCRPRAGRAGAQPRRRRRPPRRRSRAADRRHRGRRQPGADCAARSPLPRRGRDLRHRTRRPAADHGAVTARPVLAGRWQWAGVAIRVLLVFALFLGIPSLVFKWRPHDPRAMLFMLFGSHVRPVDAELLGTGPEPGARERDAAA